MAARRPGGRVGPYGFGFRRAGFEPLFVANLYYAPGKPHLLIPPAIPPSPAGFHLYGFRHQGEAAEGMSLRVDGAAVASATAVPLPPGFPGTGYLLGQGGHLAAGKRFRFYRGRIAEVLIYDRPLAEIEIDRWEDQSGHGHHAVQDDANRRPRYLPRGIHRRPAVDFRDAPAPFELAGGRPAEDGATFAAVRAAPHERGGLVRHCPAIAPRWTGGLAAFRGQLAELLVYDRTLTQDEADCVEQYLAHRYSETADPRWFDGVLCDGGAQAPQGWGRFSRRLGELAGDGATLQLAPELDGSIERLRLYARPLRVAEAISLYRHDAGPSGVSKAAPSPAGDLGPPLP